MCKKLKPFKDYLKFTNFPNLTFWFEMVSDVLDNPIVKCEACPKEFKNHTGARFIREDSSVHACSPPCRAKLHEKDRREKQKQKKADLIDSRFKLVKESSTLSKEDSIMNVESEIQAKLREWMNTQSDKKIIEELKGNACRLLKRLPQIEDISLIFKALIKNDNDAFHAMCELESQKPYDYISMRYLSEKNDSNFIKA